MAGIGSSSHSHSSYTTRSHDSQKKGDRPTTPPAHVKAKQTVAKNEFDKDELEPKKPDDPQARGSDHSPSPLASVIAAHPATLSARISGPTEALGPSSKPKLQGQNQKDRSTRPSPVDQPIHETTNSHLTPEMHAKLKVAQMRSKEHYEKAKALRAARHLQSSKIEEDIDRHHTIRKTSPEIATNPTLASRIHEAAPSSHHEEMEASAKSSIGKTTTIVPIERGSRPRGFIRSWRNLKMETQHYRDHVLKNREFGNISAQEYSRQAFGFWEKPLQDEKGSFEILEKNGKNGNLYRFEPKTGTLGIAQIHPQTGNPIQISYFKPKFLTREHAKNEKFLDDALDYFNRQ